ncbi:cytochrome P450 [Xylaria curta]|nr:cytochrome P450 [Xylaria curta]
MMLHIPIGNAPFYVVSILAALFLAYIWALPKPIPGIPFDESAKNNVFGNLPELIFMLCATGKTRNFFQGMYRNSQHLKKHNSALTQIWMGPLRKPCLIFPDFRESQDILLRRTREFYRRPFSTSAFTGVVPNHHIAMPSLNPRFNVPVALKAELGEGRPLNARRDIFDVAIDIINAVALGLEDDQSTIKNQANFLSYESGYKPAINADGTVAFPELPTLPNIAAIEAIGIHLGEQFKTPFPGLMHRIQMLTSPTLAKHFAQKDKFVRDEIGNAVVRLRKGESGTRSAMDHILWREMRAAEKAGRALIFHSPRIYDEVRLVLVAGHDTSSTAIAFQIKLRGALRTVDSEAYAEGRQPSVVELWKRSVPYLDAALVNTVILGHEISKETMVLLLSVGPDYHYPPIPIPEHVRSPSSRDKRSWDPSDMHLFKPDRWLKTVENGNVVYDSRSGPMMAFGLGPRGCFGRRLAYLEIRIVLALLVWNFEFHKLSDELSSRESYSLITKSPVRCYVSLTKVT